MTMRTRDEFYTEVDVAIRKARYDRIDNGGGEVIPIEEGSDIAATLYAEERAKAESQAELSEAEHAKLSYQLNAANHRIAELEAALSTIGNFKNDDRCMCSRSTDAALHECLAREMIAKDGSK